jgi:hypothetical protein
VKGRDRSSNLLKCAPYVFLCAAAFAKSGRRGLFFSNLANNLAKSPTETRAPKKLAYAVGPPLTPYGA